MPMSSLPAAILSHMIAVSNVPPPPLRSIPNLQKSRNIDYGELNALCHMRGKQHSRSRTNILSAHNVFMKQYPKIFVQKKVRLPKLFKEEEKRIPAEDTEGSKPPQPDDSHNIAIHVKKARGGHTLYGPKKYEETVVQFMAILKKLPIHRTPFEHNIVWKMLKTIPDLTSQLLDEHLKILSKNVISETWIKGSTVIGNDGFYIILKGLARPQTQIYKNLIEEHDSTTSFIPQSFHSFVFSEDIRNPLLTGVDLPSYDEMLGQWSTFGTLEVAARIEPETKEYSVVTEEDCEILKIPANNYAKLKTEKTKLENQHKVKLIHKCPYYVEWPTLSIYELVTFTKWKKFPPGHVIVESGNIISFVAYINSGYCKIYRNIIGFSKLQSRKVKKIQKHVYMGRLNEKESFGEISVLLQVPFTCTIVTGEDVEMAIIEDKDLHDELGYSGWEGLPAEGQQTECQHTCSLKVTCRAGAESRAFEAGEGCPLRRAAPFKDCQPWNRGKIPSRGSRNGMQDFGA
ncbi:cyclic nucleotide-binding domain-containing protein 1 [Budorcas taxicolor]|uniref:cyclic nucleotide-binding domain-containing protein 1 n=1 Tax=Budorcas taxicolor TaxID=37181 RepID=UPI0022841ED2|nr:cyclic nucleotide-binding domain-containing protein 1 [Budorcas taxicolor]